MTKEQCIHKIMTSSVRDIISFVCDIIFDAIKSIRKKSKQPDTISIVEHITRNLTNFKEVELRDSISKLVDSGILVHKKTKQDLDSLFVNDVLTIHPRDRTTLYQTLLLRI